MRNNYQIVVVSPKNHGISMYELELNFSWITWGNTKNQNSTHPQHTKINMNPLYSSRIRMMNIGTSNIGWLIKTLVVVAYCIVNP